MHKLEECRVSNSGGSRCTSLRISYCSRVVPCLLSLVPPFLSGSSWTPLTLPWLVGLSSDPFHLCGVPQPHPCRGIPGPRQPSAPSQPRMTFPTLPAPSRRLLAVASNQPLWPPFIFALRDPDCPQDHSCLLAFASPFLEFSLRPSQGPALWFQPPLHLSPWLSPQKTSPNSPGRVSHLLPAPAPPCPWGPPVSSAAARPSSPSPAQPSPAGPAA